MSSSAKRAPRFDQCFRPASYFKIRLFSRVNLTGISVYYVESMSVPCPFNPLEYITFFSQKLSEHEYMIHLKCFTSIPKKLLNNAIDYRALEAVVETRVGL